VIIIDTNKEDFSKQPHNGILIKKWNEDLDDTALLELIPFLEAVCKEDIQDVRQVP
jgi:TFIIF-interacting CTD phosphatase-like protein